MKKVFFMNTGKRKTSIAILCCTLIFCLSIGIAFAASANNTKDKVVQSGTAGIDHFNENGTIDVHAVRDLSKVVRNGDGSFDPSGKLTGVEPYSQAEFDARNIDALRNPPQIIMTAGSTEPGNAKSGNGVLSANSDNQANNATEPGSVQQGNGIMMVANSGIQSTASELAELYSIYEPFGVTYDKEKDGFYYDGKLVRDFLDVLSSNGEELANANFSGSIRRLGSPNGVIDIRTVRDYTKLDATGYGTLIGVEIMN